jgi:peptidoglycan/LPS O-acetylase OafA/YrhL
LRLGLFMCVLVLAVGASGWTSRIFSMRWLSFLGKYSYGLYVFHYMMMPLMDRWVSTERMSTLLGSFIVGMAAHLAICIGASIVVALLSWHLLEKHFLKLKRHFVPHRRDAHATERRGGYEQAQGQTVSVTVFAPAIRSCSTASTSR